MVAGGGGQPVHAELYGWLRRYEADGLDGLKDRSSRPHNSPKVTQAEVIEMILWLRKHYHFGPAKIAMYLKELLGQRARQCGRPRVSQ